MDHRTPSHAQRTPGRSGHARRAPWLALLLAVAVGCSDPGTGGGLGGGGGGSDLGGGGGDGGGLVDSGGADVLVDSVGGQDGGQDGGGGGDGAGGGDSGNGDSAGDSAGDNAAPTITIGAPAADSVFNLGETVTFEVTLADDHDATLAVTASSSAAAAALSKEDAAVGTYTLATDKLPAGKQTITFTATDSGGKTASAAVAIWINTAPSAPAVAIAPAAPTTADDLVASVQGPSSDVDRAAAELSYTYLWHKDGQATTYTDAKLPASATQKGQTWKVEVTPTDGYAKGEVGAASVVIINALPVGATVTIAPAAVHLASEATCALVKEAVDADGDAVSYTYAWTVNGAVDTAAEATASVVLVGALHRADGSLAQVGDTITCIATPSDGVGKGALAKSEGRVIGAFAVCGSALDPCDSQAACVETKTLAPSCACKKGFVGDGKSCADVDECKDGSAQCGASATCSNGLGDYSCTCAEGYGGDGAKGCKDIDECSAGVGGGPGPATPVGLPGWTVTGTGAPVGWYGTGKTLHYNDPAKGDYAGKGTNKGTATSPVFKVPAGGNVTLAMSVVLDVETGASYDTFRIDLLVAGKVVGSVNKTQILANLQNKKGNAGLLVLDLTQWAGQSAQLAFVFDTVDNIANATSGVAISDMVFDVKACAANAACTNKPGGFACACKDGYSGDGKTCTDIDECKTDNGGCDSHATCSNSPGGFKCACKPYWQGDGKTCTDIDECKTNNGGCGLPTAATCTNQVGDKPICTDIDECKAGTAVCDLAASCTNTVGGYQCACKDGYSGDGKKCVDVDECNAGELIDLPMPVTPGEWKADNSAKTTGWFVSGAALVYKDQNTGGYSNGGNASKGTITSPPFEVPAGVMLAFDGLFHVESGSSYDKYELRVVVDGKVSTLAGKAQMPAGSSAKPVSLSLAAWAGKTIALQFFFDTVDGVANSTAGVAISKLRLQSVKPACAQNEVCTNTPGSFSCACAPGFASVDGACVDIDECGGGLAVDKLAIADDLAGWTVKNSDKKVGWKAAKGELVYDDPAKGSYSSGLSPNAGSALSPLWKLPAGAAALTLALPVTIAVEADPDYDLFTVSVVSNGKTEVVATKADTGHKAKTTLELDLSAYAGASIQLLYVFDTKDGLSNDTAGIRVGAATLVTEACASAATCSNKPGSYACACKPGYDGDGKQCADIDECKSGNGGCDANASCNNLVGAAPECTCKAGYTGDGTSCSDIDECKSNNGGCDANATCTNLAGGPPLCACKSGYSGDGNSCKVIPACIVDNGGCDANAHCGEPVDGKPTCTCKAGYAGDGKSCADVDECAKAPAVCDLAASCTNTVGSYACTCNDGHSGDGKSCVDIDECEQGKLVDKALGFGASAWKADNKGKIAGWQVSGDALVYRDSDGPTYDNGGATSSGTMTSPPIAVPSFGPTYLQLKAIIDVETDPDYDKVTLEVLVDSAVAGKLATKAQLEVGQTPASYSFALTPYAGMTIALRWRFDTVDSSFNKATGLTIYDQKLQVSAPVCPADGTCTNKPGSYACGCKAGYALVGGACVDIDECQTDNGGCSADATCTNNVGAPATCACKEGFVGDGKTCTKAAAHPCDDAQYCGKGTPTKAGCYCDTLCKQYGDCCTESGGKANACSGSNCGACQGG
jgi:hypothetical protein